MSIESEKEQWVNEVLGSAGRLRSVAPAAGLHERVLLKLQEQRDTKQVGLPIKKWAAAAAILLLAVNGMTAWHYSRQMNGLQGNKISALAMQIQTETTYNY